MTLLVLTLFLLFVFSACGGGKAVKSDPVAKDPGIIEVRGVKQSPQSAQKETQTEKARDGRFIAYDNGTVSDTQTGLMWAAKDNGSGIHWEDAKSYCKNYRGGGYADWRMPTQDELAGLYDAAKTYQSDCGYDVHLTKLIRLTCTAPWASEMRGSGAATFYFTGDGRFWNPQSFGTSYARALPVRSFK
jgi:hypothetical protein